MTIHKHVHVPAHEDHKHLVVATYDFAKHGGAVGDITLDDAVLPDNAIITKVFFDVLTAPTSGGAATVAFKVASAGDLKAATAIASWTGLVDGVPADTAATMIKLSADQLVKATVAVAALTAGKIKVCIEYVQSE